MAVKVSNAKFEVEKFTGRNNFRLWQVKVRGSLGATRSTQGIKWQGAETSNDDG